MQYLDIRINGVKIPKVLAFADDIAILVADKSGIAESVKEYNAFSRCSGLYLNVDKTEIMNLRQSIADEEIILEGTDSLKTIKLTSEVTICGKTFSLNGETERFKNIIITSIFEIIPGGILCHFDGLISIPSSTFYQTFLMNQFSFY